MAGNLWSKALTETRRALARRLGVPRCHLRDLVRVSFAKVAEYQARGIVHFHAVVRLDGPDGPATPPPAWATAELIDAAGRDGCARARIQSPDSRSLGVVTLGWGRQIDVRPITSTDFDDAADLTDIKVARYIAK